MNKVKFSIIIPTCNEGEMLHMTVNSILENTEYSSNYEIVIVNDGSTDGSCEIYRNQTVNSCIKLIDTDHIGVAQARNEGYKHASGEFIVFLDAHCKVSSNWLERFELAFQDKQVAIAGPTYTQLNQPYPKGCGMMWSSEMALDTTWFEPIDTNYAYEIPLTPGGCQAFRSVYFYNLGFYDNGFRRWGSEDLEICLRAWCLGYKVVVDPTIEIQHHFRETRNFNVDLTDVHYNYLRMVHMHFSDNRLKKINQQFLNHPDSSKLMASLKNGDTFKIKSELDRVKVLDDNWFFERFA